MLMFFVFFGFFLHMYSKQYYKNSRTEVLCTQFNLFFFLCFTDRRNQRVLVEDRLRNLSFNVSFLPTVREATFILTEVVPWSVRDVYGSKFPLDKTRARFICRVHASVAIFGSMDRTLQMNYRTLKGLYDKYGSTNRTSSTCELQSSDFRLKCIRNLLKIEMFSKSIRSASHLTERSIRGLAQITTPKPFKTPSDVIR